MNEPIFNIYKSAGGWTALIFTDEHGYVQDCQVTFKPVSEYARRQTQRRYKSRARVELPEELRNDKCSSPVDETGAWS